VARCRSGAEGGARTDATRRQVAEAIRDKFGMLPQGWRQYVKSDQIAKEMPKGLNRSMSDLHHQELAAKNDTRSTSDKRIDEILDSEERFVSVMQETLRKYVDPLYEIFGKSDTKQGREHARALGLTQEECTTIFDQLPSIVRFSQGLLAKLEFVSLVRKQPMTGEGRAIHVGRAFVEMAPKLHVYAPAITTVRRGADCRASCGGGTDARAAAASTQYQNSLSVLNAAMEKLKDKRADSSFTRIWEDLVATNEVLRGQQLQAVLVTPMQRVPRYKLLLEQLLKEGGLDNENARPVVQEALGLFASAATNINEAMRKHEKLSDFFGSSDLKPLASSGATKDGKVHIKQNYTNKLL